MMRFGKVSDDEAHAPTVTSTGTIIEESFMASGRFNFDQQIFFFSVANSLLICAWGYVIHVRGWCVLSFATLPKGIFLTSLNYDTGLKPSFSDKNTIIEALKAKDINNIDNNELISINSYDKLIKFRQFY